MRRCAVGILVRVERVSFDVDDALVIAAHDHRNTTQPPPMPLMFWRASVHTYKAALVGSISHAERRVTATTHSGVLFVTLRSQVWVTGCGSAATRVERIMA